MRLRKRNIIMSSTTKKNERDWRRKSEQPSSGTWNALIP